MSKDVEIEVEVRAQTYSAIQVFDGKTTAWIPRSQISDWTPGDDESEGVEHAFSIFIPEWLAIEKGLV